MALSRRLRFEILRRDGHTCRYCGGMAPDVKLTVDHVIPTALGGSDEPSNLVAACADCNAGKSSVQPGSDLVEDVAADAVRWARAMQAAVTNRLAEREVIDDQLERFKEAWNAWTYPVEITVPPEPVVPTGDALLDNWRSLLGYPLDRISRPVGFSDGVLRVQVERGRVTDARRELSYARTRRPLAELGFVVERVEVVDGWDGPLPSPPFPTKRIERHTYPAPAGWRQSVERFFAAGLPEEEIHRLIKVTMERRGLPLDERFRFFCGCCWRAITDLQEDARRFIESGSNDAP